ncbi:ZIP family zinc transporter [Actinophytocola sp.]|uniref:ZIP family metal transporter n=1 Tax=Actinophytocola sp. TaxID=1872138 RepID=UPI0025C195C4|nr:ZIP family zinc transporter [Actinophytocola sp.]
MIESALWGFVGGSALVLGGVLALVTSWSTRAIALVMAFGSGVLISAVSFDLVAEAWPESGGLVAGAALAGGALVFFAADLAISRTGLPRRRRATADHASAAAMVIVAGAVLDGIPESAAIGATLSGAGGVSATFVIAVFLSNIPESLSSSAGLRRTGRSGWAIVGLWLVIAVVSAVAAGLGYLLVTHSPPEVVGAIRGFAAGAVLTMVASTMLPEAHDEGGPVTALVTTAGFLAAVALSGVPG